MLKICNTVIAEQLSSILNNCVIGNMFTDVLKNLASALFIKKLTKNYQ